MKQRFIIIVAFALLLFSSVSCATLAEERQREYGMLESAVTFSSDKVIGEFGDRIPDDFDSPKFMALVRDKIPHDYYAVLLRYKIGVSPKGSYYLLIVNENGVIILFDYSCSPEVDGPVLLAPGKYDLDHLEKYDTCK